MIEKVEKLRNIAIVGHGGAGKTSLVEAMLFNAGIIKRLGRVEEGNTTMDFEPEEIKRTASISSGFFQFGHKKHTVSLIDTPGDQNFFSDTKSCMQAADGAVVLVDAVDGVKVQTEQAWEFADVLHMPTLIFINKLDRERADFSRTFEDATNCFESPKPIILHLPIGTEAEFNGIVDLISMKAYTYDQDGKATKTDIPSDMQDTVEIERETLIENIAEADDSLIEKYLEGEELTDDELQVALKQGILNRIFVPVLCGSATNNIGVDLLLDFIATCMPSPIERGLWKVTDASGENEIEVNPDPNAPFSAFVFKTIADPYAGRLSIFRVVSGTLGSDGTFYNINKDVKERFSQLMIIEGKEQKNIGEAVPGSIVAVAKLKETVTGNTICDEKNKLKFDCAEPLQTLITFSLQPKSQADEDKLFSSLSKLLEEDPALTLDRNAETKEILLSGLGQVHIEVTIEKLRRKFNVEVNLNRPKIPYKETIKKKTRAQGKHKKQSGGHGQFGDCWIDMEPMPRGKGFEFVDGIVGGVIPRQYIPAVEKGINEACVKGILAGFPCIDFKVTLNDGSFHSVDSSEMAFKIAGSLAFKKAAADANPVLLEPIMKVAIKTPDDFMGDIMGDLNSRRGRVLGMDNEGKYQIINANVPMSEFLSYAPDLRSMTGGRGIFTMEFSHYDEVPAHETQKILDEVNKEKEND
ncbi:MAG: elongation factor G [Desulfobacterales bacterium]|jgi:elongation factor G|nr:elongation factor G [Desulfobacteraceae bacterium]MBT4365607.1 elongation factor G [Desulfobacteraceae bacterium]MBT7087018.1 elongation factor G [Desulfobacterales bacterium]MBT7697096.1 elongation factor G [Desulfobacterales bacterium]